jgi:hypothetical protein
MLYSLLRGSYNKGRFADGQDVDLAQQIGAERYELGADGFPTDYQSVSFAPVNWLTKEKNADHTKLLEKSQSNPLLVGTLATTIAFTNPDVPAGLYSVLFRREGVPRELVDAVKQGHKELSKNKPKDEEKAADTGDDKKPKKAGWRDIVTRFGLTDEDLLDKEAADGQIKFIRIDGVPIPIKDDVFLLHDNEGKIRGVVPSTGQKPAIANAKAATFVLGKDDKGKGTVELHALVPLAADNQKRLVEFELRLSLDREAPGADKPWRTSK